MLLNKKSSLVSLLSTLLLIALAIIVNNVQAQNYPGQYQQGSAAQSMQGYSNNRQGNYYSRHYRPNRQLVPASQQQSPAQLLENSINKVIYFLSQPKDASLEEIGYFLNKEITPHFDFHYMARWVAGRYFRAMSAEQQQEFIATFSELFVTTFVQKLSNYQQYPPVVDNFRSKRTSDKEALATANIVKENGSSIQVDFKFLKTSAGWKVVDVRANGVSALYYYRNYFAGQIKKRQQQQTIFR